MKERGQRETIDIILIYYICKIANQSQRQHNKLVFNLISFYQEIMLQVTDCVKKNM